MPFTLSFQKPLLFFVDGDDQITYHYNVPRSPFQVLKQLSNMLIDRQILLKFLVP